MTHLHLGVESPARKLIWLAVAVGAVAGAFLVMQPGGGAQMAAGQQDVACENYSYQEEAQAAFMADPEGLAALDSGLPGDPDGVACETLPRSAPPSPPAEATEAPEATPQETLAPEAPVAGATYSGDVEAVDDCGGGTVSVVVSDDGTGVTSISVSGVGNGSGDTVSGSGDLDPPIPIGDDGHFDQAYIDVAGGQVTIAGSFDGDTLTGSVLIDPSTCGPLSFSAVAGAVAAPTALPVTGAGDNSSDGSSMPWAIVGGLVALFALGAGAFYLRRRMT